ncbi:MAG: pseudouridine-5'-phosphate glycosidase [Rhodoferax sp.]|nr:pseudouridine-5'-phosphate glycosidase [Actinomycetota bacterium]
MAARPAPIPAALELTDEVRAALTEGAPVVALESTIISHGLPRPDNLRVAREIEAAVRAQGAVPATAAVVDGRVRIGLDDDALAAVAGRDDVAKAGVRDLAVVVARGGCGATTVAATAHLAALAGVRVFATGGLGGVHRGAATTFDESADLVTLARVPITVVCAGVKSILDIGLTLEYLETHGVPVIGVGQKGFPAFFTRESGFDADFQCDSALEQAAFIHAKWALGLRGGVVVSNAVPAQHAMPKEEIDRITEQALAEAQQGGVTGKAVTPFLLGRIKELTEGRSLATNIALVMHNALIGAQLARALHDLPGMKPL